MKCTGDVSTLEMKRHHLCHLFFTHQNNPLLLNLNIAALSSHFHHPSSPQYYKSPGTSPDLLFGLTWFSRLKYLIHNTLQVVLKAPGAALPLRIAAPAGHRNSVPLIAQIFIFLTPQRSSALEISSHTHCLHTGTQMPSNALQR